MKKITQNYLKEIVSYNPETGIFIWIDRGLSHFKSLSSYRSWITRFLGKQAGSVSNNGYVVINTNGKLYTCHRLAWLYVHGTMPYLEVDHIDGDRSNNKIANLRLANRSENNQNKRSALSNNKLGVLGVSLCKSTSKYRATIVINKKQKTIGRFNTKEEAHEAYLIAKREIHPRNTI